MSTDTGIVMSSEITIAHQLHLVFTNPMNNQLCLTIVFVTMIIAAIIPVLIMDMELDMQIIDMSVMGIVVRVIGGMMATGGRMIMELTSIRSVVRNKYIPIVKEILKDNCLQYYWQIQRSFINLHMRFAHRGF